MREDAAGRPKHPGIMHRIPHDAAHACAASSTLSFAGSAGVWRGRRRRRRRERKRRSTEQRGTRSGGFGRHYSE